MRCTLKEAYLVWKAKSLWAKVTWCAVSIVERPSCHDDFIFYDGPENILDFCKLCTLVKIIILCLQTIFFEVLSTAEIPLEPHDRVHMPQEAVVSWDKIFLPNSTYNFHLDSLSIFHCSCHTWCLTQTWMHEYSVSENLVDIPDIILS
jgi:hypothetical protein